MPLVKQGVPVLIAGEGVFRLKSDGTPWLMANYLCEGHWNVWSIHRDELKAFLEATEPQANTEKEG